MQPLQSRDGRLKTVWPPADNAQQTAAPNPVGTDLDGFGNVRLAAQTYVANRAPSPSGEADTDLLLGRASATDFRGASPKGKVYRKLRDEKPDVTASFDGANAKGAAKLTKVAYDRTIAEMSALLVQFKAASQLEATEDTARAEANCAQLLARGGNAPLQMVRDLQTAIEAIASKRRRESAPVARTMVALGLLAAKIPAKIEALHTKRAELAAQAGAYVDFARLSPTQQAELERNQAAAQSQLDKNVALFEGALESARTLRGTRNVRRWWRQHTIKAQHASTVGAFISDDLSWSLLNALLIADEPAETVTTGFAKGEFGARLQAIHAAIPQE